MGKGADGACSRNAFIGTWGEVIPALMRRLERPYFRVGFLLSVGSLSGVAQQNHEMYSQYTVTDTLYKLVSVCVCVASKIPKEGGARIGIPSCPSFSLAHSHVQL